MKRIVALLFLSLPYFILSAQEACTNRFEEPIPIRNKYRQSSLIAMGNLKFNGESEEPYFDGDGGTELFEVGFSRGIWAGGFDESGDLKVAAAVYDIWGGDYIPGPILNGAVNEDICSFYKRVWQVDKYEISLMLTAFQEGQLTIEAIPKDILEWPAIGNPYNGEFALDYALAPFFDNDSDGIYNPLNGDYPIALDENPDFVPNEFRFYVFNDMTTHNESEGEPIGMEFHVIDYVLNCEQFSESESSIFTRLKYIYKGQETMRDFRLAIWDDWDLGCFTNDYVGCSPGLNASYVYNIDGMEPLACDAGINPIPSQYGSIGSLLFLNKKLESHLVYFNGGQGGPPLNQVDPQLPRHYYNYMNAKWMDGSILTEGNFGFNIPSVDTTFFSYPDFPNQVDGWSLQEIGAIGLDYRTVSTFERISELNPGHTGVVDFVDHILLDQQKTGLDIFEIYEDRINGLKDEYNMMSGGQHPCGGLLQLCMDDCVWPGDVNDDGYVSGKDIVLLGNHLSVMNNDGAARSLRTSKWFPYNSSDWNLDFAGVNAKYADVDGSGSVDPIDLKFAEENLQKTRIDLLPEEYLNEGDSGTILNYTFWEDSIEYSPSYFRRLLRGGIQLEFGVDITVPIHGLSLDIKFDTNMVVLNDGVPMNFWPFDESGSYTDGPLRAVGDGVIGGNKVHYYGTNLDDQSITSLGFGFAGNPLIIRDDLRTNNLDGRDTFSIKFYNVFGTNVMGEQIEFSAAYDSVIIYNIPYDPDWVSSSDELLEEFAFTLSPNPAGDHLNISFSSVSSGELSIYSCDGTLMSSHRILNSDFIRTRIDDLNEGFYFVTYRDHIGNVSSKRFLKM